MANKTHYENLKVARDAPSDVIRAAYKALTHKYNSDRNSNTETQKLLEIINASNAVISNPIKRAEYDQWLLEQESLTLEKKAIKKTSKSSQKAIQQNLDDGNEIIIGKDSDVIAYKNNLNAKRWFIYVAIGLVIALALAWMFSSSEIDDNSGNQPIPDNQHKAIENTLNQANTIDTTPKNVNNTQNTLDITSIDIPVHDKVSLSKFVGKWEAKQQTSSALNTLEISKKSESTLIFQLNSTAEKSVGGTFGIADFNNSYALFFNEEYDCSILFTMKSNMLQVSTNSCQEYHKKGISFDGFYSKPTVKKVALTPAPMINTEVVETVPVVEATQQTLTVQPVVVKKLPKLYKYLATVKDLDGNVSEIELIAKDKDAAKVIIRDFRGNPEVLKLKQLKK